MAAIVLTVAFTATSAQAQDIVYYPTSFPTSPVWISSGYSPVTSWSGGPAYNPQFGYYSYYVVSPYIARGYVPYGVNDQFPFYGQPYGHAYDAWTWDNMGGWMANRTRYFYPPVR
jgi:hypothetical protein